MSKLEKEFKAAAKEINAKIKEAAKAMKEANAIAKKAGIEHMHGFDEGSGKSYSEEELNRMESIYCLIKIRPLFDEIDQAGWRTSSIGC